MAHGLTITETASGVRNIRRSSMAIIGLMATSTAVVPESQAAIDAAFPLNTAVLVTSVDVAAGKAGSGGTLKRALEAIGDEASPLVIVVRVEEGEDQAETDANVIGSTDGNVYTGLQALLAAETLVGKRPRILGAPGLDTQEVVAEMYVVAKKLRSFVYFHGDGDDVAEVVTYRGEFGQREGMILWPDSSPDFAGDIVARALGLRARIDEEQGWHKSISNVPFYGVTGATKNVHFDLMDNDTDAGVLNDAQVTTIIRASGGYRLWGNRTTAGDDQPEFSFETAVRTSHALQDIIATAVQPFLDQPMTVGRVKDLLETINAEIRQLVSEGRLMGGEVFFDADANSPAQLAAGRPNFRLQYTPVAPMENPQVSLVITDYYYSGFADQIANAA
ncbi:phage tail sheath subtilisin-like domain-containing protein [Novosphingobium sp. SL115]|uniref:phage tail sheath subtilisin-like domain-containing protein n=1 Tax=Novosphingobium sp. SL115 TaxID=2995150 RepID=UPI002273C44C|nr:phage tail sheath subtilisin-like domain-containing protein [Novosphingobium sp. SL115]MCY1672127.1 phage tail sheath subtilisin-like domain-containing protein [Novosphingobium sp. SL115]